MKASGQQYPIAQLLCRVARVRPGVRDRRSIIRVLALTYLRKENNIAMSGRCDPVVHISHQYPFCPIA
jgi:hypothetical protein